MANQVTTTTSFQTLMQLAKALGQAKKGGDKEAIAKAQTEHDAYKEMCLRSDQMTLGMPRGAL